MKKLTNKQTNKLINQHNSIFLLFFILLFCFPFKTFAYNFNADPYAQLTPEQIAKHPTDKWFTADRPDYRELDERIRYLAKNEETPQAVARIICEGLETDIEKARAIFDWLAFNIAYDTSYSVHSGESAFKKRKGVCQGYAELFLLMAQEVGLTARMITGIGFGDGRGGHAWNVVELPDRDILLDSCWGAGGVAGRNFKFQYKPWWFDVHPAVFAYTHLADFLEEELIYPPLEKKAFYSLPRIDPNDYLPYGKIDPIDDYRRRFCPNDENLPVSFSSYRSKSFVSKYISTGPELTDGFFISDHEITVYQLGIYLTKEELNAYKDKTSGTEKYTAVTDLPLYLIARYCNKKSIDVGLEKCYTITGDDSSGYKIECDYSKCGLRLPTKKEWLIALGDIHAIEELSEKDFSDVAWYEKNSIEKIRVPNQTKKNSNQLYDMLGNVSELCFDEETGQYVFMGGNFNDSRQKLQELIPVPFDDYKTNKGAHGFRLVFNAPTNPALQFTIAQLYDMNTIFNKDSEKYEAWFNLAVKNEDPAAMAELAGIYFLQGTEESFKECYDLCIKAAKSEQHYALNILARMYLNGYYVSQNEKTAFEYYERSAVAGNLVGRYKTSQYYKEGKIVPKDDEKYRYWLEKAVLNGYGNEDATMELCKCYMKGIGGPINESGAYILYSQLVKKENPSMLAWIEYADCLMEGKGVSKNEYLAVNAYEKASEMGSIYAKAVLGECAYLGKGMSRDIEKASKIYSEIVEDGFTNYGYAERNELYKYVLDAINYFDDNCKNYLSLIPKNTDPSDYLKLLLEITSLCESIQGSEMTNSALLWGFSIDEIRNKVLAPLQKISEQKKLSGKTLIIINPYKGKKLSGVQDLIYTYDCFSKKQYRVNGELYRYDKSFYEYYDNVIFLQKQEENLNSIDTAFGKIMPCLSDCDEFDLMIFSTDYFAQEASYVDSYRQLAKKMIDRGKRPRIIVLGNKTDIVQQSINQVFSDSDSKYAEKINVFGSPYTMQNQLACGFRNDKLFIVMLTEKISSRHLLIYLDETGWAPQPTRQDTTFVQSSQNLSKMAGLGLNKSGTITKPGKMVMHYKVVK